MVVGANYSTPVTVNGFLCKNCTDVDYAKKHIGNLSNLNAEQAPTGTPAEPASSGAIGMQLNVSA